MALASFSSRSLSSSDDDSSPDDSSPSRMTSRLRLAPASSSPSLARSSTVIILDPNPPTSPSPIASNSSYASTPTAMDRLSEVGPFAPVYRLRLFAALTDALLPAVAIITPRFARLSSSFVKPVASLPKTTATFSPRDACSLSAAAAAFTSTI